MSKKPTSSPGPWEAVNDGDGDYRVRVKDPAQKSPSWLRTVAEGFHFRKDAVLAASAPELAAVLRALLDNFVALHDSGDAGCVLPEDDVQRLAAEALLKRVKV